MITDSRVIDHTFAWRKEIFCVACFFATPSGWNHEAAKYDAPKRCLAVEKSDCIPTVLMEWMLDKLSKQEIRKIEKIVQKVRNVKVLSPFAGSELQG